MPNPYVRHPYAGDGGYDAPAAFMAPRPAKVVYVTGDAAKTVRYPARAAVPSEPTGMSIALRDAHVRRA